MALSKIHSMCTVGWVNGNGILFKGVDRAGSTHLPRQTGQA